MKVSKRVEMNPLNPSEVLRTIVTIESLEPYTILSRAIDGDVSKASDKALIDMVWEKVYWEQFSGRAEQSAVATVTQDLSLITQSVLEIAEVVFGGGVNGDS